jgi:hypothetical protein
MIDEERKVVAMNLISAKGKTAIGAVLAGIFLTTWLAGCQSFPQRDMGKFVPDFNRVAIPSNGGTGSQTFKTNDMSINYQDMRVGDQLKVWGSGEIRFESINQLVFHLYFLDERGQVITIDNFFSYVDHSDFEALNFGKRHFHRDFTIPDGAVAFAIGYDGVTGRVPGSFAIPFSHYPFDE